MDLDSDDNDNNPLQSLTEEGEERSTQSNQHDSIIRFFIDKLKRMYSIVKNFPNPLNELSESKGSSNNNKNAPSKDENLAKMSHTIEQWEEYKLSFYTILIELSNVTNELLQLAFPIYYEWYSGHFKQLDQILESDNLNIEVTSILQTQARSVLAYMEEYFLLAHRCMPSWRILTSSNQANTKIPMEITFFYEICRIRVICDVFSKLNKHLSQKMNNTSNERSEMSSMSILNSLKLLPPNISKWTFPFGVKFSSKSELMVPYYRQSQLETSFKFLFFKLNLIGFHNDIANYIEELLCRLAWIIICPYGEDILDLYEFRAHISETVIDKLENNFIIKPSFLDDIIGYNLHQEEQPEIIKEDKDKMCICNRNYVYRNILRYFEIVCKLAFRSFIFETVRVHKPCEQIIEFSTWLQNCINQKFEKTQHMMKSDIYNKYSQLLLPPSDKEWTSHFHHLQYISENSVWVVLHPEFKELVVATANREPKKIYYHPTSSEASIFESIVVKLLSMIFASKFDFLKGFVIDQDDLILQISHLKTKRRMPALVQNFNRYSLLYRGKKGQIILYEYQSIFDTIAAFFNVMINDFKREGITFVMLDIISALRKTDSNNNSKDSSKSDSTNSTPKGNQFSTLQTKTSNDNENNKEDIGRRGFF